MAAGGDEVAMLRETFVEVVRATSPQNFGTKGHGYQGVCDRNAGVQWNAWMDFETGGAYLGVNLEGMKYDGWPIERLTSRELRHRKLFETRARVRKAEGVEVRWLRDAWSVRNRLRIKERFIAPTPTALDALTEVDWIQALEGALGCLAAERNYRGRGKQPVTLLNGNRVERQEVSPHLQFRRRLWAYAPTERRALAQAIQAAREQMQPLYDFVAERCV